MTATQMTQAAALLGTTDRNAIHALSVGLLVKSGMAPAEAIETVFGPGSWAKMAGAIQDALKAKA